MNQNLRQFVKCTKCRSFITTIILFLFPKLAASLSRTKTCRENLILSIVSNRNFLSNVFVKKKKKRNKLKFEVSFTDNEYVHHLLSR